LLRAHDLQVVYSLGLRRALSKRAKTTLAPDFAPDFDSTFADHWRGRFEGHPGKFRVFLFEPETELLAPFLCSLECAIAFLESENTDSDFDPSFITLGEFHGNRAAVYQGEPIFYTMTPDSTPRLN